MMQKAYIALGGNLEDPVALFLDYLQYIDNHPNMQCIKRSSLYQSAAIGYTGQPDFINAVILIETSLSAMALLDDLQVMEKHHGRQRLFKNSPRTLDLDLLLYDSEVIENDRLLLPHPRMLQRAFVLLPLLEISPDVCMPDGQPVRNALSYVSDQLIQKLDDSRWS